MTVRDCYKEAILGKHYSLKLLIELLVYEKKALDFQDSVEKLKYFLQDRFRTKINEYLTEYEARKEEVR